MTAQEIANVWAKAKFVSEENERNGFRKDACGAWIQKSRHGDRKSPFGWEVDHIKPVASGGTDNMNNLRPLQWENNAAKGDGGLVCAVTAKGEKNAPVGRVVNG